ncbi:hypothetical protein FB451DRAFT_1183553 [Mycena latifolia]|nr:hypothetical protein FB451DRAFT_1183553 [Mycena latifolia]
MTRGKIRAKASLTPTRTRHSTRLQAKNNDEAPEIHSAHASPARDESPPWLGIEGSQYSAKVYTFCSYTFVTGLTGEISPCGFAQYKKAACGFCGFCANSLFGPNEGGEWK